MADFAKKDKPTIKEHRSANIRVALRSPVLTEWLSPTGSYAEYREVTMLYNLIFDPDRYRSFHFDDDQITRIIGELDDDTVDKRIDINGVPRRYQELIREPLSLSFPIVDKADKEKPIPDLNVFQGRLFLSNKAYNVLKPLLEEDGEFLTVTYEMGVGYFFTPLKVAEDVEAIDWSISKENQWNYFDRLTFHEDRVKDWSVFRMRHDGYLNLFCQEAVKRAIEKEGLAGLYITNDLASVFPQDYGSFAPHD